MPIHAYGAYSGTQPLEPMQITRRAPGAHDVQIDILYCGICHSDLHQVRSEWAGTKFPCVPGHEIVGRVSAVGAQVSRYQVGDLVGVGCIVGSCPALRGLRGRAGELLQRHGRHLQLAHCRRARLDAGRLLAADRGA